MQPRIVARKVAPGAIEAMNGLEAYVEACQHFTEQEMVNLTLAVVSINGWNRIAISFRSVPGTYQPAHH